MSIHELLTVFSESVGDVVHYCRCGAVEPTIPKGDAGDWFIEHLRSA